MRKGPPAASTCVEVLVRLGADLVHGARAARRRARTGRRARATRCRPALALGALQGDDVVAFQDRLPAEAGDQPLHQGAHAARALIGHRPQRVGVEQEFLVLGADAPGARAACEPAAIQAMRSSRERTVGAGALSWRVDIGLIVSLAEEAIRQCAAAAPLVN